MRQKNFRMISVLLSLFLFMFTIQAHASGAKRPDIEGDGAVITDVQPNDDQTTEGPADTTTKPSSDIPSIDSPTSSTRPSGYSHLDPENLVPKILLDKAVAYFEQNKTKIKRKDLIGVIDFAQKSTKERFYLIDLASGHVETYLTAHGKGSDADHDGYATVFSNQSGSQASSLGYYLTAETYQGSNGYSLRLDGLSSTNSNARSRAVVIHGAEYVTPGSVGRSWGCPALDMRYYVEIINKIKGGMLIYAERSK
jgi:hypothetical protein